MKKVAKQLVKVLENFGIGDPLVPESTKEQNLIGLFTNDEIQDLLNRDKIRQQIRLSMKLESIVSLSEIAKKTNSSITTVRRVWRAILKEYPIEHCANGKLALPKETRAFNIIEEILSEVGFSLAFDEDEKSGTLIDNLSGMSIPFRILRTNDMLYYLKVGCVECCILGSDRIVEAEIDVRILAEFRKNSFRLCIAVPKDRFTNIDDITWLNGKIIATSYPVSCRTWAQQNNIRFQEIIDLEGGLEKAITDLKVDAILDMVETGNSLRKHGLEVLVEVRQESMNLIAIQEPTAILNFFIKKLLARHGKPISEPCTCFDN